jgi:hypothetical protein
MSGVEERRKGGKEYMRNEAVCTVPVSIPVFEHSVLAS